MGLSKRHQLPSLKRRHPKSAGFHHRHDGRGFRLRLQAEVHNCQHIRILHMQPLSCLRKVPFAAQGAVLYQQGGFGRQIIRVQHGTTLCHKTIRDLQKDNRSVANFLRTWLQNGLPQRSSGWNVAASECSVLGVRKRSCCAATEAAVLEFGCLRCK